MDQNEEPKLDQPAEVSPSGAEQPQEVSQPAASDSSASSEPQVFTPGSTSAGASADSTTQTSGNSGQVESGGAMSSSTTTKKPGLSRLWRRVAIIAAIVIVLAGGSAAAFFTVYLPHQPWYILDTALKNTMAQNDFTINANVNATTSSMAVKLASITAANLTGKQIDENLTVTVAGASIPVEVRVVNSKLYFKFGDLSSVA